MLGDPGILYKMSIYYGLKLNGVISLETTDKVDRKIAYAKAVELLSNNGNLLIYPEGAWNVSPNVIVMKIFTGTVRLVMETGAEIIPIAVEQYDNNFYFNIGKNYKIDVDFRDDSVRYRNDELRDKLATLKWEIMERQGIFKRSDISNNYLDVFQKEIVDRCNYGYGFSLQDALNESFHDKNVVTEEEVFEFLYNIDITKDNCYLEKMKRDLVLKRTFR